MNEQKLGIPLWVEKIGRNGGRDHLGLESVGQTILEDITSGISNITKRARYYSFFCWIIKAFFDSELPKNKTEYLKFLRRVCFLYTVSNSSKHLSEPLTGIDGIDFTRTNLQEILSKKSGWNKFLEGENKYLENDWIYQAKLNDLKLTFQNDITGVPALVEPYGKLLAEAFDNNLKGVQIDIDDPCSWNQKYFDKLESRWCFHNLINNESERKILEDVFFARKNVPDYKELNRRYSLLLLLLYINEFKNKELHGFERWIYNEPKLPENLNRISNMWKMLFARNYLVFSLESLFLYFLNVAKNENLNFEEFSNIAESKIKQDKSLVSQYYYFPLSELVAKVTIQKSPQAVNESELIIPLDLMNKHQMKENILLFYTNSILTMVALYKRYKKESYQEEDINILDLGGEHRLSLLTFINMIDHAIENKLTVKEFINKLLFDNLLPRQQLVATEKMYSRNLDTFHFTFDDGKYSIQPIADDFRPKYNVMKINEICSFFEDLGLVAKIENEKLTLTERGKKLIDEFYG